MQRGFALRIALVHRGILRVYWRGVGYVTSGPRSCSAKDRCMRQKSTFSASFGMQRKGWTPDGVGMDVRMHDRGAVELPALERGEVMMVADTPPLQVPVRMGGSSLGTVRPANLGVCWWAKASFGYKTDTCRTRRASAYLYPREKERSHGNHGIGTQDHGDRCSACAR